jgi:pSer/pThr/pTyr-binding forkhead associated (FHA) protein
MGVISTKLDQLEYRLQTLIEGRLARLLPVQESPLDLTRHLVTAMKAGTRSQADGSTLAPDSYILLVDPDRAQILLQNQPLLVGLADAIFEAGDAAGLRFGQKPSIRVSANSEMKVGEITVIPRTSAAELGQTVETDREAALEADDIPQNAFLIVNGVEIFSLDQPLINIGRRSSNDLVIDDPRISRQHAQIRAIHGKFVLFDLDSKGGTFLNGNRINQGVIHPRDVISLAGIPLVYGQEDADLGKTQQIRLTPSKSAESPSKDSLV